MCSSCIEKVTPVLNDKIGEDKWTVDTVNPRKILSVQTDSLNEEEVINIVKSAGYQASKITE